MRVLAALLAAVVTLVGCAGGDDAGKLHDQANAALARWADAVAAAGGPSVVPVGDLTGQVGDWEPANGDNKQALAAGLFHAGNTLPIGDPPDATVTWPNGLSTTVPVLPATLAVSAMQAVPPGSCDGCKPLRISAAELTSGPIETSRGPAVGPIWEFTIEGTAVKITRVAIANAVQVVPPAFNPDDRAVGVWVDSASGSIAGRQLEVAFIGAPPDGGGCGEDYTTEAVESDLAVVVIVFRHPHFNLGACTGVGFRRTATVELADRLADRAVLQVYDGTPISVELAP